MAHIIQKDILWDDLSFIDTNSYREHWRMNGPFKPDVLAGLIVAGFIMLTELDANHYSFSITNAELYGILEVNDVETLGQEYIVRRAVSEELTDDMPATDMYGIWVFNSYDEDYFSYWDLIQVRNLAEFMQGFITMCNAFQVDFRNYILYLPTDSEGIEYDLPDYNLSSYLYEKYKDLSDSPLYDRDDLDG